MKTLITAALVAASLSGCGRAYDSASETYDYFVGNSKWVMIDRSLQAYDDARPSTPSIRIVSVYTGGNASETCREGIGRYALYSQRFAAAGSSPVHATLRRTEGLGGGNMQVRFPDNSGSEISCEPIFSQWKTWK